MGEERYGSESEYNVISAASCIDHFIVDIKTMNPHVYRAYTGGNLDLTLQNLERLLRVTGSDRITVRIPAIPGFTTQEDQLKSREELIQLGIKKFDLFDYILKT